jgi:hypothetical protein
MVQVVEQLLGVNRSGGSIRGGRSSVWLFVSRHTRLHVFTLVTAIAGCAIAPVDTESDYPKSFPKVSSSSGACPIFANRYSNRGISYNPANSSEAAAVLSRDIFRLGDLIADTDEIEITVEVKTASKFGSDVRALSLTTTSGEKWDALRGKSAACLFGQLQYLYGGVGGVSSVGLLSIADLANLYVAVDGSVIIRGSHLVSGTALVIPYRSRSETIYYRFPSVNNELPKPQ